MGNFGDLGGGEDLGVGLWEGDGIKDWGGKEFFCLSEREEFLVGVELLYLGDDGFFLFAEAILGLVENGDAGTLGEEWEERCGEQ